MKADWVLEGKKGRTYALSRFYCENAYWCPNGRDYDIGMYAAFDVTAFGECTFMKNFTGTLPPGARFDWYVFMKNLPKD